MTRRKGEITLPEIKRKWPHHVALPADAVRGETNSRTVWSFAETLSAAPRPFFLRRDNGDFVVFCFARPEDADPFCERFDGERSGPNSNRLLLVQNSLRRTTPSRRPERTHELT